GVAAGGGVGDAVGSRVSAVPGGVGGELGVHVCHGTVLPVFFGDVEGGGVEPAQPAGGPVVDTDAGGEGFGGGVGVGGGSGALVQVLGGCSVAPVDGVRPWFFRPERQGDGAF